MAKRDYYEVLGVGKTADEKELKTAFRKLAKQFHPDPNPGDKTAEAKFKEINEAYEMLKDPQKRAAYDRFGHQAFENGMGGGRGPGGAGFGPDFASSMSDIFEDLFGEFMGGGGAARPAQRWPRRHGRPARLRPALQSRNQPDRSLHRQDRADPRAVLGVVRSLQGLRRQARHRAQDLRAPAAVRARCARSPASSPSSAPAPPVRAAAR